MSANKNNPSKVNPQNFFQPEQFLLITMINLILLTVDLTIFNICFLLIFITTALKFYKTYVMEKHFDLIQIPTISTKPKTSICVHFLSIAIHDILTNKILVRNLMHIGFTIVGYFFLKWIPVYVVLMIIVDAEYAYCLWKRRIVHSKEEKNNIPSKVQSKPNDSTTQSSNLNLISSFMCLQSSHRPTRSTFTQNQSGFGRNISQFSQSPRSPSHLEMKMIEQVEEDKVLDEDLPQISTINIISTRSSTKLR